MARRVDSFNELLQTSPPGSDFFEGLDEEILQSVLQSFEASTQTMSTVPPPPPPPPQPQAAIQAVDPPAEPEAGPSQRRAPSRRYSRAQTKALEALVEADPNPTYEQKKVLSEQIGLRVKKISQWIQRYKTRMNDIQSAKSENVELKKRIENLIRENEELQV